MGTAEEEVDVDLVRVVRRLCVAVVVFVGVYPPLEVMERPPSVVVVTEGGTLGGGMCMFGGPRSDVAALSLSRVATMQGL